jgi:hypothetical protein
MPLLHSIYHPTDMPPRRDPLQEQQLVRDLWQQVEARIDVSGALRAFLTQKIDDCGQTVAFEAFDLVRQVFNPDGWRLNIRCCTRSQNECRHDVYVDECLWGKMGRNLLLCNRVRKSFVFQDRLPGAIAGLVRWR